MASDKGPGFTGSRRAKPTARRGASYNRGSSVKTRRLGATNPGAARDFRNGDMRVGVTSIIKVTGDTQGVNEVQRLTETGSITGGTYTITGPEGTTAAIPFDATATTIQARLNALGNPEDMDDIVVSGGPVHTTPVDLTFTGRFGHQNVAQVTVGVGSLTGSTPGITVTTVTPGSA